ncbi:MAG: hypothetical protein KDA65_07090 [Planctomycetaceae bacterium]|nr:hypothetical protein [Planctomycetaceae bacterium]
MLKKLRHYGLVSEDRLNPYDRHNRYIPYVDTIRGDRLSGIAPANLNPDWIRNERNQEAKESPFLTCS